MRRSTSARRLLSLMVAALAFSGCSDSTGPRDVTMRAEFVPYIGLPPGEPFSFSVQNTGNDTLYLNACDGQVTVNFILIGPGLARDEQTFGCLAIFSMVPVALKPGGVYRGTGYAPPRSDAQLQPFVVFARSAGAAPNERVKAPILER
jgi:hypothetical protein